MLTPTKQDQLELDLTEYLIKYREYYKYQIDKLAYPSYTQIKGRYLFSVFSVHRQFNTTVRLFKAFKTRMPENIRLEELIDRKAGLYTQAIQGLKSWPMVYRKVLECYNNRANLRQFILKEIKGLGLAKVSFFLALCFPYDNYLCLDTWMLKFLEIDTKDINTLAKYEYVENYIGKLARVFKYTPFMFQWALWEYHQKKGPVDHSCLYN